MKARYLLLSLISLAIGISGCTSNPTTPTATAPQPYPAYPIQGTVPLPTAAGLSSSPYPGARPTAELISSVPFVLDKPLVEGATRITGSAPPNIPVIIVDVSLSGTMIGSGVTNAEGRFDIQVTPLTAPNIIGIMVELPDLQPGQFVCGATCRDFPQVGVVYDYAVVGR